MKRLFTAFAALTLITAAHAADTKPAAKAAPAAKPAAAAPAPAPKAKEPVMTRDELRACFDTRDANDVEAKAINEAFKAFQANETKLKSDKEVLVKDSDAISARVTAVKAEFDAITKANEEFKVAAPKMEKADFEAKRKELTDRSTAFDASRTQLIADDKVLTERKVAFGEAVDKSNATLQALQDRRDAQLDKTDEWKAKCGNKKYDENDEKALKKERAAAAAAASAPK
ncbi:hypothetical protein ACFJGW_19600 [Burkholderiaceae bacterium UC74_6]